MIPLTMPITPNGQIEEIDRQLCAVYRGDDRAFALRAALEGLEAFASAPENREMVCDALDRYAPELAILAGHVATIHRLEDVVCDRDLDDREMRAALDMHQQTANPWAQKRADQVLIDNTKPLDDQIAVHDGKESAP